MDNKIPTTVRQRGFFFTIEGGNGVGKSTQQRLLCNKLKSLNIPTIATHEPGNSPFIGNIIRSLLLELRSPVLAPKTELLLFLADRAQNVAEIILPALNQGQTVVCDRFIDSNEVYLIINQGLDQNLIQYINRLICADAWPDLTLLLDLNPEEGLKRILKRQKIRGLPLNRFEALDIKQHHALREKFITKAIKEPERIKIVDSSHSEKEVAERIWSIIKPLLKTKKNYDLG